MTTSGRVAVLASFMTDLTVRVARRPGPGETVVGSSFQRFLGGKGCNQAIAAARTCGSAITGDPNGATVTGGTDRTGRSGETDWSCCSGRSGRADRAKRSLRTRGASRTCRSAVASYALRAAEPCGAGRSR